MVSAKFSAFDHLCFKYIIFLMEIYLLQDNMVMNKQQAKVIQLLLQ